MAIVNPLTFLLQFAEVLVNWSNQLTNLLTYQVTFNNNEVPVWSILAVSGIAIFVIIAIIKNFL